MPARRRSIARRELTVDEYRELLYGLEPEAPWAGTSCFASEDERRQAWRHHRSELMAHAMRLRRRPAAWWRYESPEPREDRRIQAPQLLRLGVLTHEEIASRRPEEMCHAS